MSDHLLSPGANRDLPPEQHRLYWHSRRGMLELEYVLVPFVRERLADLAPSMHTAYAELLEHEDWDIFDWIQGREAAPTAALAEVVAEIVAYNDRPR
jgi:antitoxin CptB